MVLDIVTGPAETGLFCVLVSGGRPVLIDNDLDDAGLSSTAGCLACAWFVGWMVTAELIGEMGAVDHSAEATVMFTDVTLELDSATTL